MVRTLLAAALAVAGGLAAGGGAASGADQASPYAGMAGREVKALSAAEVGDLLAGRGAGMALPAELNGYPGPLHALELAREVGLSAAQREQTQTLFERMRAEAVPLGEALVAAEAGLERLFASGAAGDEAGLRALVAEAARLRGELRFTHLRYHLAMKRLLTPAQVAAYDAARGYAPAGGPAGGPHEGGHGSHGGHGRHGP